jgi:hypothetical protein
MTSTTVKLLSEMSDEGLFERLATAVLREADPRYSALVHPGVNADGKTVKSPLDGIPSSRVQIQLTSLQSITQRPEHRT